MLARILAQSRNLIIIAVAGSLLASVLVTVFATADMVRIVLAIFQHGTFADDSAKRVALGAVELSELFLLSAVLYVIALGLYQLFVGRDVYLPDWLEIPSLDNLKERLLGTVLVMLAISFFGYAVTWDGSLNILGVGISTGVVIAGISYTLAHAKKQSANLPGGDLQATASESRAAATEGDKRTQNKIYPPHQ